MIFLLIALAIAAAIVAYGTGAFIPAVIVAVLAVWSNGIMWNFRDYPPAAPNWSATVSFLSAIASVILLIVAIVLRAT